MKKYFLISILCLISLISIGQTISNLPSNIGTVVLFKENPISIPIIMPTGYTVPSPVTSEVWQINGTVGSKIASVTPTTNVSGQTVTVSLTSQQVAKLASLSGSISYFVKFNGNYLLGGQLRIVIGTGIPSVTPVSIQLPSIGQVKINLIGDASAALQYAQLADSLAEVSQVASENSQTQASLAIAAAGTATTQALSTKNKVAFGNASKLRAYPDTSFRAFTITDKGREGIYNYNSSSSLSDDTSKTIVSGGRRYERVIDGVVNVKWYGAKGDGSTDDTQSIQNAINKNQGGSLFFPEGIYLAGNIQNNSVNIIGAGSNKTILKVNEDTKTFFLLGWDVPQFRFKSLKSLTIDGVNKNRNGVMFSTPSNPEISGRWLIEECLFINCDKAYYKPTGDIGNSIRNCLFYMNNYGYFSIGDTDPFMHGGFDDINTTSFLYSFKSGVYINSTTPGTGRTVFTNCHFEQNYGFGVFVANYKDGFSPLRFSNLWLELNGTLTTVNIEGVDYSPMNVMIRNADNVLIDGAGLNEVEVFNSHLKITDSYLLSANLLSYDSLSVVTMENSVIDGIRSKYTTTSIKKVVGALAGASSILVTPKPSLIKGRGNAKYAESFSNLKTYTMGGSTGVNSTPVFDPFLFDYAAEFTIPSGAQVLTSTTQLDSGKYYVIGIALKHVSGSVPPSNITLGYSTNVNTHMEDFLTDNKWHSLTTIGKCELTGTSALYITNNQSGSANYTIRVQGMQIKEFDTEAQAIDYYNARILATEKPLTIYGSAAPSSGSWVVGDRVINSTPTVSQPKSWVNTVSGSPGTFVSEGNL